MNCCFMNLEARIINLKDSLLCISIVLLPADVLIHKSQVFKDYSLFLRNPVMRLKGCCNMSTPERMSNKNVLNNFGYSGAL